MSLTNAETAILGLVAERPQHGYELEQVIERRGVREWTDIGFSSIYFLLGRLEKKQLVARLHGPGGPRARKQFAITPAGREALALQALAMIAQPEPAGAAVLVGLANWPALDPRKAIEALRCRLAAVQEEHRRLAAVRDAQRPLPPFVEAMFDYTLARLDAELGWAERAARMLGGQG
jgi:DNA-binding PadR family transcriptional regulator